MSVRVGSGFALALASAAGGCVDLALPPTGDTSRTCAPALREGFLSTEPGAERDALWMAFIDVGHGDATWLRLPGVVGVDADEVVIDAGDDGLPDAPHVPDGGAAVLDLMARAGMPPGAPLTLVLVTHPDKDHYGGVAALLDHHPADSVLFGGRSPGVSSWHRLEGAAGPSLQPAPDIGGGRGPSAIDLVRHSDVALRLLASNPGAEDDNDASLVVEVGFGGRRVLLMADAEETLELKVAASARPVDILRAGHHGGIGTSGADLLERVLTPDSHAIVSAGERPGLPHPDVIDRLAARVGARLWRTDRGDAGRTRRAAAGDDHVIARLGPDGRLDVCYLDRDMPAGSSALDP